MKDIHKLKQLNNQLAQLSGEMEALRIEISNKQKAFNQKQATLKILHVEVEKLKDDPTPKVSEHAIVRYFERVKGYDLHQIEKEILSDEVLKMVEQLGGDGAYPNEGFQVRMKNFTVVTIVT